MTNRRQLLVGMAAFLSVLLAGSRLWRRSGVPPLGGNAAGSADREAVVPRKPSLKVDPPLHSVKRRG